MKMPNWCSTSLTITGHTEEQKKFLQDAYDEYNKSMTEGDPDEVQELGLFFALRRPPNGKWDYDWCVDNWGTKWDISEGEVNYEDGELSAWGQTAWGPPLDLCEYLVKKGYDVWCEYTETGMGFGGVYHNGHNEHHDTEDYENFGTELARRIMFDGDLEGSIVGTPTYQTGDLIFWERENKRHFGIIMEADTDPQDVDYPNLPEPIVECMSDVEWLENNKITGVIKLLADNGVVYDAVRYDEVYVPYDGEKKINQLVIIQE